MNETALLSNPFPVDEHIFGMEIVSAQQPLVA
jgi:hypothetical protein